MWMALYIDAEEYIDEDWDYTDVDNVRVGRLSEGHGAPEQIVHLRILRVNHIPGGDTTIMYGFAPEDEIDLCDVRGPFIITPEFNGEVV